MKEIKALAGIIQARLYCIDNNNTEWIEKHEETIHNIETNFLPHGNGVDNGCQVDIEKSTGEKIIISTSFHHMDDVGYYDGWTDYKVIIKPSLVHDFIIKIMGDNRNMIKDYLTDLFYTLQKRDNGIILYIPHSMQYL